MTECAYWADDDCGMCGCCDGAGISVKIACVHEHVSVLVLCAGAIAGVEAGEILCLPCLENKRGHPCVLTVQAQ